MSMVSTGNLLKLHVCVTNARLREACPAATELRNRHECEHSA
jgi:hypothetical protein